MIKEKNITKCNKKNYSLLDDRLSKMVILLHKISVILNNLVSFTLIFKGMN